RMRTGRGRRSCRRNGSSSSRALPPENCDLRGWRDPRKTLTPGAYHSPSIHEKRRLTTESQRAQRKTQKKTKGDIKVVFVFFFSLIWFFCVFLCALCDSVVSLRFSQGCAGCRAFRSRSRPRRRP